MIRYLAFLAALLIAISSSAVPLSAQETSLANVQLSDPVQEAKAKELMESLRCLTCQSQSIADSDAEMAEDMRHLVRTRVQAGESSDEIRNWLVERYGDYVSYSPDVIGPNWPLYAIPGLLLLVGIALFLRRLRGRS